MKTTILIALLLCSLAQAKPFSEASWSRMDLTQPWISEPHITVDVKWHRGDYSPYSEVRDGMCHLYYRDDNEDSLRPADSQIEQCVKSGKPLTTADPAPGVRRLEIYNVPVQGEADRRLRSIVGAEFKPDFWVLGFYMELPNGNCLIVSNLDRYAVLGHEIKHCFDGAFHGKVGQTRWLSRP